MFNVCLGEHAFELVATVYIYTTIQLFCPCIDGLCIQISCLLCLCVVGLCWFTVAIHVSIYIRPLLCIYVNVDMFSYALNSASIDKPLYFPFTYIEASDCTSLFTLTSSVCYDLTYNYTTTST